MDTQLIVTIGIVVLLLILAGVAVWAYARSTRSRRLKAKFGPEYDQTIERLRDRELAETELQERERRVARLHIVPLSAQDSSRYRESWIAVQGHFVDDPKRAVEEGHQLVHEVMQKRGYPVTNFEQVAADLSVKYSDVISHYRAASRIADNNRRGTAKTEELRQALIHYRALFEELLENAGTAGTKAKQTYPDQSEGRLRVRKIMRGGSNR
jgi:cbb3-type cytochrome oxidase subunit 3